MTCKIRKWEIGDTKDLAFAFRVKNYAAVDEAYGNTYNGSKEYKII